MRVRQQHCEQREGNKMGGAGSSGGQQHPDLVQETEQLLNKPGVTLGRGPSIVPAAVPQWHCLPIFLHMALALDWRPRNEELRRILEDLSIKFHVSREFYRSPPPQAFFFPLPLSCPSPAASTSS